MKKILLYDAIVLITLLAIAVLGCKLYYQHMYDAYKSETQNTPIAAKGDSLVTNSIAQFTDLEISIYGKWAEQQDSLSYMVFTLDDAGDGYFWGKEWCESENVMEEDLEEYGSGWFKWRAKQNRVLLLHQTNVGIVIPAEYTLIQVDENSMSLQSHFRKSTNILNRIYN